jgi:hypothetical protein
MYRQACILAAQITVDNEWYTKLLIAHKLTYIRHQIPHWPLLFFTKDNICRLDKPKSLRQKSAMWMQRAMKIQATQQVHDLYWTSNFKQLLELKDWKDVSNTAHPIIAVHF